MPTTINITKAPGAIDFIKNEPYFEFEISGYGSERKSVTTLRFRNGGTEVPYPIYNGTLTFEFFGNRVTFLSLYGTETEENKAPDTFMWKQGAPALVEEFNKKIKNHYLLSQYYDINITQQNSDTLLIFTCKEPSPNSTITITAIGTQSGTQPSISRTDGSAFAFPKNWRLWAKFRLTIYENANNSRVVDTPEIYLDRNENNKIRLPLTIIQDYFDSIDFPISPVEPINRNIIQVQCLYAETFGEGNAVQWIQASNIYKLAFARIQNQYYNNPATDWKTENGFININANTKIIPYGMNTGENVRIFRDCPQWIYLASFNLPEQTTATIEITITERDGTITVENRTQTIRPDILYRIHTSVKELKITQYDIIQYRLSIKDNSSDEIIFRRQYTIIEKPYNARIFLLQNKYGLLEPFYSDNHLEEKTVDGNRVVLDNIYKIDITNTETVYTVRSGSKRPSELQVFKAAVENHFNFLIQDNWKIPITILPDTFTIHDEEEDLQNIEFSFILSKDAESLVEVAGTVTPQKPTKARIITLDKKPIITITHQIPIVPL